MQDNHFMLLLYSLYFTDVTRIFGVNMFENRANLETFLCLLGVDGRKKPFEVRRREGEGGDVESREEKGSQEEWKEGKRREEGREEERSREREVK